MSLDFSKVAPQVSGMVGQLKAGTEDRQNHLHTALETLGNQAKNASALKQKAARAKTTWLVAGLVDGLAGHYPSPAVPADFTVVATDGSHIDVDRHRAARCYLINTGSVTLHYGASPEATLESFPFLFCSREDLVISPGDGGAREQSIEGGLLGAKRSVEECRRLVEVVKGLPPIPTLALLDGSLILWGLEAYPDFVSDALLEKGLLPCFSELSKMAKQKEVALASYISLPRSTDVVNLMRVALCPNEAPDCDRFCAGGRDRECDAVADVEDVELFSNLLGEGERSDLFMSQSSVVRKHYGEHWVFFFYVKTGDEIARIEVPQWVAENDSRANLVHSLVLDQCRRGQGYPVALSEAHEQAVVRQADREQFWKLVESYLVDEHLPSRTTGKDWSKRTRWV